MKYMIFCFFLLLLGCEPNDTDFDKKVDAFKATDIGIDLSNGKFIPPYKSFEPLIDYTHWCNSVLWPLESLEEATVTEMFMKEEVLVMAPVELLGIRGLINGLIDSSGGVDAIYSYAHGDAAYLMKPSPLAVPIIKSMLGTYTESASFKKAIGIAKKAKRSKSYEQASSLCFTADTLTGILGGESRSRRIISDVSSLVQKNTLRGR